MPEHTLEERLKNRQTKLLSKTERALRKLEGAEQGGERNNRKPAAPRKPNPAKPAVGVGQSSFDLDGAIAKIQARIAASNDPTLKAKLKQRIQALKENAE